MVSTYLKAFGDGAARARGKASTGEAGALQDDSAMQPVADDEVSAAARQKRVLKYWPTGRQVFSNFDYASVSVDVSRVGGRPRMLLAMALPTGQAMWLCPQAPQVKKRTLGGHFSPEVPNEKKCVPNGLLNAFVLIY